MAPAAFQPPLPLRLSRRPRAPLARPRATPRRAARRAASAAPLAAARRPENAPGNVFVDTSCIDCDTCRWLAPAVFHADAGMSAVHTQPASDAPLLAALQAAAACPTGSIRTETPSPLAKHAAASFPMPASDARGRHVPSVFYNGFCSRHTFGASSWLVVTPHGNVMVDCPRFFEPLAKNIDAMGGLTYLVLTHSDDVAGHDRWANRFSCDRVMHVDDCNAHQKTNACEMQLHTDQFPYQLMPGIHVLHVPGHTRGSVALFHEPSQSLFTGDHLAYSSRVGAMSAFPRYCGYSWDVQRQSVLSLRDVDFLHGFPGHGRAFHFDTAEQRRTEIERVAEEMKGIRAGWGYSS